MNPFEVPAFIYALGTTLAVGPLALGYLMAGSGTAKAKKIAIRRIKSEDNQVLLEDTPEWDKETRAFIEGEALLSPESLNNRSLSTLLFDAVLFLRKGYKATKKAINGEPVPGIEEALDAYEAKAEAMSKRGAPPVTEAEQEVYMVGLGQLRFLLEEYASRNASLSSLSPLFDREEALRELEPYISVVDNTLKSWDQVVDSHEMNRIVMVGA